MLITKEEFYNEYYCAFKNLMLKNLKIQQTKCCLSCSKLENYIAELPESHEKELYVYSLKWLNSEKHLDVKLVDQFIPSNMFEMGVAFFKYNMLVNLEICLNLSENNFDDLLNKAYILTHYIFFKSKYFKNKDTLQKEEVDKVLEWYFFQQAQLYEYRLFDVILEFELIKKVFKNTDEAFNYRKFNDEMLKMNSELHIHWKVLGDLYESI